MVVSQDLSVSIWPDVARHIRRIVVFCARVFLDVRQEEVI